MIELKGDCKIFAETIDYETIDQIKHLKECPVFKDEKIRIMPDCHKGAGAVIGFTSTMTSDMIIPNVIGVDLGCAVLSVQLSKLDDTINLKEIDKFIHHKIPHGCNINSSPIDYNTNVIKDVCERTNQNLDYVLSSYCSLGGGNHFIEIGTDSHKDYYITVHSGSRNFGLKIAQHYQKLAKQYNPYGELSWLDGELANMYKQDMKTACTFAKNNRRMIIMKIVNEMGFDIADEIESVHNYIDLDEKMIRKGAISAKKDEYVLIPFNMQFGIAIAKGIGNDDWNNSAPHGAGRILSRSKAKSTLTVEEYEKTMEGIYSSCINKNTLDEAPMAYKNPNEILSLISDTLVIEDFIKPIYNFKASE